MLKTAIFVKRLTPDLKNAIKDCLYALIYRKQDLVDFFKSCNLTSVDLRGTDINQTKSQIIDRIFSNFLLRTDLGSTQVRSIIESLINWSDFDSYWFSNGTLDKKTAQAKIENLKKLLGEKTKQDEISEKKKEKEEQQQKVISKRKTLEELNARFSELCKMSESSQKRGYELEKLLVDLFNFFEIEVESAFKLEGEQIDGSFNFLGDNYIFEAKWQDIISANNDLYVFAYKIESNTLYPRGIFLSINGYSNEAIARITHNKKPQLILLDAADLLFVLEGRIDLKTLLKLKIKHAQTRGEIYTNAFALLTKASS
jgi:hypothetical protein